jgi:FtsH-binding integral membrane protein
MYIAAFSTPSIVLTAAVFTAGITVALTIYAFNAKTDFTYCGAALFIFGAVLSIFAIFLFFIHS